MSSTYFSGRKNGFALEVKVPDVSFNKGWTLAIRFPLKPERGTFQSWNAFFWNVYERNGELIFLMHQPWWWTDRQDKTSITFVADHMPTEVHRKSYTLSFLFLIKALAKIHLYKGRQKDNRCFSDYHGQRQEGSIKSLRSEEDIETEQRNELTLYFLRMSLDICRFNQLNSVIQVKVSSTLKSSSRTEKLLNNTSAKILRQNCKNDTANNYVASDKLSIKALLMKRIN